MIHDRGEWSILPTWSMPKFHIVRGGKVIETVKGWPRLPTSHRQPLIDALRRAGLLEQESAEPDRNRTRLNQSLMRNSYADFCLKKNNNNNSKHQHKYMIITI